MQQKILGVPSDSRQRTHKDTGRFNMLSSKRKSLTFELVVRLVIRDGQRASRKLSGRKHVLALNYIYRSRWKKKKKKKRKKKKSSQCVQVANAQCTIVSVRLINSYSVTAGQFGVPRLWASFRIVSFCSPALRGCDLFGTARYGKPPAEHPNNNNNNHRRIGNQGKQRKLL